MAGSLRATFSIRPGDRFRVGHSAALLGPPSAVLELLREALRECEEKMANGR